MKNQALTLAVLSLFVLVSGRLGAVDKAAIDARIEKASSCLGDSSKARDGFLWIVEAASLAAPGTSFSPELTDKVEKAKKIFETTSIVDPDGVAHLRQAFRLVNAGRDFEVPESVSSIQSAVDYIQIQLAAARKDLGANRMDECVRKLLAAAVMVVTPKQQ